MGEGSPAEDDITANYHGGNEMSEAANLRTNKERDRALVAEFVLGRGWYGSTCDEAQEVLGLLHQTCSARFSELKRDLILIRSGQTRLTRTGCKAEVCIHRAIWALRGKKQGELFDACHGAVPSAMPAILKNSIEPLDNLE